MNMKKLFLFSITLALSGCGQQCSSKIIESLRKNVDINEIILEKKNCGATTDFVYELSYVDSIKKRKNVILVFDSNHQIEWPENDKNILDLRWINEHHIDVYFHVPIRVFHENNALNGLSVRYNYRLGTRKI